MLLNDFDENKEAIIMPEMCASRIDNFPEVTISCFSEKLFNKVLATFNFKKIGDVHSAVGLNPIYEVEYKGIKVALFNSYVGAAGCVAVIEDLFAMGLEKLVLFGTCGVLDKSIKDCSIVIPDRAVRDEGTSYHYMPACDEVKVNEGYI